MVSFLVLGEFLAGMKALGANHAQEVPSLTCGFRLVLVGNVHSQSGFRIGFEGATRAHHDIVFIVFGAMTPELDNVFEDGVTL